jgi:hypothetical protein
LLSSAVLSLLFVVLFSLAEQKRTTALMISTLLPQAKWLLIGKTSALPKAMNVPAIVAQAMCERNCIEEPQVAGGKS